jgi:hypothetical protein
METSFPEQFRDLERFAASWAKATREGRYRHRIRCTIEEVREFYDAISSRREAIMKYLNRTTLADLPEADRPLVFMMLAYMDASRAIEVIGAPEVHLGLDAGRFKIVDRAEL